MIPVYLYLVNGQGQHTRAQLCDVVKFIINNTLYPFVRIRTIHCDKDALEKSMKQCASTNLRVQEALKIFDMH